MGGNKKTVKTTVARATTSGSGGGERRGRAAVDTGDEEFERQLRVLFAMSLHRWCKSALEAKTLEKMPTNQERSDVLDDLVAIWACPVETQLDAAVETFMIGTLDADVDDEVDCPQCKTVLEIPEDFADGALLQCSNCDHEFDPDEVDDDSDGPDGDGGEPLVVVAEIVDDEPPTRRRA